MTALKRGEKMTALKRGVKREERKVKSAQNVWKQKGTKQNKSIHYSLFTFH